MGFRVSVWNLHVLPGVSMRFVRVLWLPPSLQKCLLGYWKTQITLEFECDYKLAPAGKVDGPAEVADHSAWQVSCWLPEKVDVCLVGSGITRVAP